MDINVNHVVFEPNQTALHGFYRNKELPDIMTQLLESGYFVDNTLNMDRFLLEDKTIDLEKLELAISLAITYLENFDKNKNRIYINLGNIEQYFDRRGNKARENASEELQFILGFCQSVANEETLGTPVEIRLTGDYYV